MRADFLQASRLVMICHLEGWVGRFLGGSYGFQGGTEWDLSLPKEYEKGYYRKLNAI